VRTAESFIAVFGVLCDLIKKIFTAPGFSEIKELDEKRQGNEKWGGCYSTPSEPVIATHIAMSMY